MSTSFKDLLRGVAAAALVAAASMASGAQAGECPADGRMPNARQPVDFRAVGVTDATLDSQAEPDPDVPSLTWRFK